jgi:hypothetical protein
MLHRAKVGEAPKKQRERYVVAGNGPQIKARRMHQAEQQAARQAAKQAEKDAIAIKPRNLVKRHHRGGYRKSEQE